MIKKTFLFIINSIGSKIIFIILMKYIFVAATVISYFYAFTIFMGLDDKPAIANYWAKSGYRGSHLQLFHSIPSK